MYPIPKTFSVRDLQRKYRDIIDTAKKTKDAVVLMKGGSPEAVLLDVETYNELVRDEYFYDEDRTLKLIKEAKRAHKAGKSKKLTSWDELDK